MKAMRRDAGLTLLELLVAMTLLALIGAAAAGGLRFGLTVWERGDATAETGIEDRVLQKFVLRQIAQARVIQLRSGDREPKLAFAGEARRIEFIAPLPARLARHGDYLVAIELSGGTLGPRPLLLRWSRVGQSRPELTADAPSEVLLSDVTDLRLRYFGDLGGGVRGWTDTWVGQSELPVLVQLRVEREAAPWPPLIIRLDGQTG